MASESDRELARRYAPCIRFDAAEPFLPQALGYTIFRRPERSPSFPRDLSLEQVRRAVRPEPGGDRFRNPLEINLPPGLVSFVIEYAVWWDWDIQHLYELEHLWVYVSPEGRPVWVEGSWHGGYHGIEVDGRPLLQAGRPVLYSQPGKHAFAPDPSWFEGEPYFVQVARDRAGEGGVLVTPLFAEHLGPCKSPSNDDLVRSHLARFGFTPTLAFTRDFDDWSHLLMEWTDLERWIPRRVRSVLEALRSGSAS